MFHHEGTAPVNAMCDLMVGVFKNLNITSSLYSYLRIKYTEQILRNSDIKKNGQVLLACKEKDRGLDGNQWTIGAASNLNMEQFWVWSKFDGVNSNGYEFTGEGRWVDFENELLFEMGNSIRRKYHYIF